MNNLPIGCILCFASTKFPADFLPCDGRELSKNVYSELYSVIGGTWGETTCTFFLPDLRGQFIRGWDNGSGIDPDSGADSIRPFGSEQMDTFQGHSHDLHIDGNISEANLDYESHEITYGTNTFSSNDTLKFKSVITPSESKELNKNIDEFEGKYGHLFKRVLGDFANRLFRNVGIRHSHELPKIEIRDAKNSTFQSVRTSVETRPKNIALMYCIKVK